MKLTPLFAAAISLTMACGCSKSDSGSTAAAQQEELPTVDVMQVFAQEVPQITEYTATVEAYKTNNITTSTPNRIKSILVDIGSNVRQGQRLVVLDNVNIDQLKVRLDNTEREYNRQSISSAPSSKPHAASMTTWWRTPCSCRRSTAWSPPATMIRAT